MWWEKMPQEGEDISGKRLVARKRREASRSIPLQSIHPYPQPLFKILRATFILLIGDKNNYVRLLIIITTFSSSASGLSSGDKKKPTSHTSLSCIFLWHQMWDFIFIWRCVFNATQSGCQRPNPSSHPERPVCFLDFSLCSGVVVVDDVVVCVNFFYSLSMWNYIYLSIYNQH